jgi:hypothetical protein
MTTRQLLTKDETDNIIQAFGLRLIDWKRMTDEEAGERMTDLINRIGWAAFDAALFRARELAPKPRMLILAAIMSISRPGTPNYVKNPPDWDADELWRNTFISLLLDERRKEDDAYRKRLINQATEEQAAQ